MLAKLPDTDILTIEPDAQGIDIWAPTFKRASVPTGIGVYCFYDPTTGSPCYIGSGCGTDTGAPNGLWLRVKTYRWPRKNRVEKSAAISQLVKERGLLLKVWLAASGGDARKYEWDAIVKHRPPLNKLGATTPEAIRERIRAYNRAAGERRKQRIVYQPDAKRACTVCGRTRRCRFFPRHPRMKFGVYSVCKKCKAEQTRAHRSTGPVKSSVPAASS